MSIEQTPQEANEAKLVANDNAAKTLFDNSYKEEETTEEDTNAEEQSKDGETLFPTDEKLESTDSIDEDPSKDEVVKDEEKKEESEEGYKLSLGEESLLGEADLKAVEEFATKHKLSNEVAQELVASQEAAVAKIIDAARDAEESQIEAWRNEVISDPVMGGENLKQTSENARRVVERFGGKEIIDILETSGYGNNPHVLKLLSTIGAVMSEDQLVRGGKPTVAPKSTEDLFYGS